MCKNLILGPATLIEVSLEGDFKDSITGNRDLVVSLIVWLFFRGFFRIHLFPLLGARFFLEIPVFFRKEESPWTTEKQDYELPYSPAEAQKKGRGGWIQFGTYSVSFWWHEFRIRLCRRTRYQSWSPLFENPLRWVTWTKRCRCQIRKWALKALPAEKKFVYPFISHQKMVSFWKKYLLASCKTFPDIGRNNRSIIPTAS